VIRRLLIACVVAAGAVLLIWWGISERPAAVSHEPATHTVLIEGMRFAPEVLTVNAGDTVVWLNKDMFPHTATSMPGGFDSQQINASESWKHTFDRQGEFSYVCSLHPPMKATVKVK